METQSILSSHNFFYHISAHLCHNNMEIKECILQNFLLRNCNQQTGKESGDAHQAGRSTKDEKMVPASLQHESGTRRRLLVTSARPKYKRLINFCSQKRGSDTLTLCCQKMIINYFLHYSHLYTIKFFFPIFFPRSALMCGFLNER